MSAWVVSRGHIDVLVNACAEYDVAEARTRPRELGQALWDENVARVNYRYGGNEKKAPRYALTGTERRLNPIAVLKAIDCYQYQIAEGPDWRTSQAYEITERLRNAVFSRYPRLAEQRPSRDSANRRVHAYRQLPAYNELPWGFESLADAESAGVVIAVPTTSSD